MLIVQIGTELHFLNAEGARTGTFDNYTTINKVIVLPGGGV